MTAPRLPERTRSFINKARYGFDVDGSCPICRGIEGCSHSIAERRRASKEPGK